jgi:hypothetical protein
MLFSVRWIAVLLVVVAVAAVTAVVASLAPASRQEGEAAPIFVNNIPAGMAKRRTIMKVFAVGLFARPLTNEQRKRILPKEVPDTLRLYLDGKIDQFWFREDKPGGVVFLLNSTSVEEARSIVEALPLAANGYLVFEYIPVGPLQPLGLLIEPPQPE